MAQQEYMLAAEGFGQVQFLRVFLTFSHPLAIFCPRFQTFWAHSVNIDQVLRIMPENAIARVNFASTLDKGTLSLDLATLDTSRLLSLISWAHFGDFSSFISGSFLGGKSAQPATPRSPSPTSSRSSVLISNI